MNPERPTRVLVVDDESGLRETLVDILEFDGYDVSAAGDGEQAIEAVRDRPIDVVVMDVRMPRCDGITAMQAISPPPPAVIIMTAYTVDESLQKALDARVFAILHKPFPVNQLLALVASVPQNVA